MTAEKPRIDPVSMLRGVLALEDTGARTDEDIFVGASHPMPHGRVYGGQVVAQCVVAASRTIGPDRFAHSLHGYFLRPGDVTLPTTFAVDRIHDGRSFARRRVQAYQNGVPIFSGIISFQDDDPGLEHRVAMPAVPPPDEVPEGLGDNADIDRLMGANPIQARRVRGPVFSGDAERSPLQATWMRVRSRLGDDQGLHRAVLAYMSDFTIQEPTLRATGVDWSVSGLRSASLDHALWWHRPMRADEWLLYVAESGSAQGGRGMNTGRLFTQDGVLVASVAQEIMVRVPTA